MEVVSHHIDEVQVSENISCYNILWEHFLLVEKLEAEETISTMVK